MDDDSGLVPDGRGVRRAGADRPKCAELRNAEGDRSEYRHRDHDSQRAGRHRQPRRGDVPDAAVSRDQNDPMTREDAELNRKLKSICRALLEPFRF